MRGKHPTQERFCREVLLSHCPRVLGLEGRQCEGAGCFMLTLWVILSHTHTFRHPPGLSLLLRTVFHLFLPASLDEPSAVCHSPSEAHFTTLAFGPKLGGNRPSPLTSFLSHPSLPPCFLPALTAAAVSVPPPLPAGRVCRGNIRVPRC